MFGLTLRIEFGAKATTSTRFEVFRMFRRHISLKNTNDMSYINVEYNDYTEIVHDLKKLANICELLGGEFIASFHYAIGKDIGHSFDKILNVIKKGQYTTK